MMPDKRARQNGRQGTKKPEHFVSGFNYGEQVFF
jgi:hypothetical protein